MKEFSLFLGAIGQVCTIDVTSESKYHQVVSTVKTIRNRLLSDKVARQPFLSLFSSVYRDNGNFPDDLKPYTPIADQVPNAVKIAQIRNRPPTDIDVIDFLENAYPSLYMAPGPYGPQKVIWGETLSGQDEANKERVSINVKLIEAILSGAHTVSSSHMWFQFMATFMHELGHSSLVWYGAGACDSPQLGGIERESGIFTEKAFFGGVSCCEFEMKAMRVTEVGLTKDGHFYPLDDDTATNLTKLNMSKGLPIIDLSTLSPLPPTTIGRMRAKFSHPYSTTIRPLLHIPGQFQPAAGHFRSVIKNDKTRILPPSANLDI